MLQDSDYTGPSFPVEIGVLIDVITTNTQEQLNDIDRIIARASQSFAFIREEGMLSPQHRSHSPPIVQIINSCANIDRFIEVLNLLNIVWPNHSSPEIVNLTLKRRIMLWASSYRWETCDIQRWSSSYTPLCKHSM